jgi:alpha-N-arabinofuranosidase
MKFIGVGNEQWGADYIERYKVFEKAIHAKYPDIKIISGSGPSPDGEFFDYGWKELKKLNAQIVDEHYYNSPEWFLKMQIDTINTIEEDQKFLPENMPHNRLAL